LIASGHFGDLNASGHFGDCSAPGHVSPAPGIALLHSKVMVGAPPDTFTRPARREPSRATNFAFSELVGEVTAKPYRPEPRSTLVTSKAMAASKRPGATEPTTDPNRGALRALRPRSSQLVSATCDSSTSVGSGPLCRASQSQARSGVCPTGMLRSNLR
jgi:hypothetical protein